MEIKTSQLIQNQFNLNVIVDKIPKSNEESQEMHVKEKYGFVREDQLRSNMCVVSPSVHDENLINELRPYFSDEDLDLLITALAVKKADEQKQWEISTELHRGLVERFGKRGKRFWNRFQAYKSFEDSLIPFLKELKDLYGNDTNRIKPLFDNYFEIFINKTLDRIWVAQEDTRNRIENKIIALTKKYDEIWIYARKPNDVARAERAFKKFMNKHKKHFDSEVKEYISRGKIAKDFRIYKKQSPNGG